MRGYISQLSNEPPKVEKQSNGIDTSYICGRRLLKSKYAPAAHIPQCT